MGLFNKRDKLPPIGNYPGYEASDSAFTNARATVLSVFESIGSPEWTLIGDSKFIEHLMATKLNFPRKNSNIFQSKKTLSGMHLVSIY